MKLIVGLGNPGREYESTRHNAGIMVVEAFASRCRVHFTEEHKTYSLGSGKIDHETILIAKSLTFMNRSGSAVQHLLERADVDPSELIVIHDDIDLPLGRVRIKTRGGHGGHKGILSIISTLQTDRFCRLRIGVGRPPQGADAARYVLHHFLTEEQILLSEVIRFSGEALTCVILEGTQKAMDRFNRKLLSLNE